MMNVIQLNTDIYNSLGVLSNDESYLEKAARYLKKMAQAKRDVENAKAKEEALASIVLEHNNAESCRHHCQQDSASVLFKQIFHFNFLLNYSAMLAIRHPIGCNHREMNGLLGRKRCF